MVFLIILQDPANALLYQEQYSHGVTVTRLQGVTFPQKQRWLDAIPHCLQVASTNFSTVLLYWIVFFIVAH